MEMVFPASSSSSWGVLLTKGSPPSSASMRVLHLLLSLAQLPQEPKLGVSLFGGDIPLPSPPCSELEGVTWGAPVWGGGRKGGCWVFHLKEHGRKSSWNGWGWKGL